MTITDADRAAAEAFRAVENTKPFGWLKLVEAFAAHRIAGFLAGRESMQAEAERLFHNPIIADAISAIPLVKP